MGERPRGRPHLTIFLDRVGLEFRVILQGQRARKGVSLRRPRGVARRGNTPSGAPSPRRTVDVSPEWVKQQLSDLAGLLKDDVARVKAEFRRLNLALTFTPVEAEPRPHYVVKGQCDLSALALSFVRPADRGMPVPRQSGAVNHLITEQSAPLKWMASRSFRCRSTGNQVHNRTPVLLIFSLALPSVEARGRWRERGKMPFGRREPG